MKCKKMFKLNSQGSIYLHKSNFLWNGNYKHANKKERIQVTYVPWPTWLESVSATFIQGWWGRGVVPCAEFSMITNYYFLVW